DTYLIGQMLGPIAPSWAARYDAEDLSLRHQLSITLKTWLSTDLGFNALMNYPSSKEAEEELHRILLAVQTPRASRALLSQMERNTQHASIALFGHIARNGDEATVIPAIEKAKEQSQGNIQTQVDTLVSMNNGFMERGGKPPVSLTAWASELAESLLTASTKAGSQWTSLPHPDFPQSASPWCLQERKCADGKLAMSLISLNQSQKSPEKLTGILRSKAFAAPARLSFWLCGHQGFPKDEPNKKNLIRLMNAQGEALRTVFPPRGDVCQKIEWDLAEVKAKTVHMEMIDGDGGTAYAWLGVTRFEPAVVSVESFNSDNTRQKELRALATMLKMSAPVSLRDRLRPYLPVSAAEPAVVSAEDRKRLDTLIAARMQAFAKAKPDATKGAQVFTANCTVCHQIKNQGGLIGPQLDGIGNRGADRLMEDILDPNRNVDANFQMHLIKLLDDSTLSGFIRGEVGQVVIVVDAAGQERRVSKNEIKEDKATAFSLMPPMFGQTIPEADFYDLLAFLLTKS
ncbi:MAG: hypothetical protein JWO94_1555, partial [Verrucomicrobiaceae bacterium]|nr:hypothetical protein [Verrucomicrobiaceae bacterium]